MKIPRHFHEDNMLSVVLGISLNALLDTTAVNSEAFVGKAEEKQIISKAEQTLSRVLSNIWAKKYHKDSEKDEFVFLSNELATQFNNDYKRMIVYLHFLLNDPKNVPIIKRNAAITNPLKVQIDRLISLYGINLSKYQKINSELPHVIW